ncbi:spore coat protein [Gorillibacterium massiliense]|uniref:spore coat protein n=1 Tax=Gorillibacterium massiliense TaxID=1280390 RepID=UPI0004B86198|nr:spore coat protein [Gorillibacterium massiliense]
MQQVLAKPKPQGEPQVKGPEMNDRDRINDELSTVKSMTHGFNTGLNEMQNPTLHRTVSHILNDLHEMEFTLFNTMFDNGWYKIKTADPQEIRKTYDQFNKYHSQFPNFS